MKKKLLTMLVLLMLMAQGARSWGGSGTSDYPEGNAVKAFILNFDDTSTNIEGIQNPNSQL